MMRKRMLLLVGLLVLALMVAPLQAQDEEGATADEVNAIAKQLYCPVCENVPLDTCPTAACEQWRDEIRIQLDEGFSVNEIINDFVNRYGDRVVGTPQDPLLRNLSLITPWVMAIVAVVVAMLTFLRWRSYAKTTPPDVGESLNQSDAPPAPTESDDVYRARLEEDLRARA